MELRPRAVNRRRPGAGPHRPAVVKPRRGSSAALRPLRGDDADPMRLCCIHGLCCAKTAFGRLSSAKIMVA
jgi:hypothetical protein